MNYYDKETLKKIHTDETVIIEGYDGKIHITREYIGDIYLPTGEIVAFDPVRRYENYLSNDEYCVIIIEQKIIKGENYDYSRWY